MSISTLSHRLVFGYANTLPLDLEDRMQSAFTLGRLHGEELSKLNFRAIESQSRRLPKELGTPENYAISRAIAAAYYHGVSTKLLATKMETFCRDESLKLAAHAQRLMLQLIVSVPEVELEELHKVPISNWITAFTGALSVARVAVACHNAGFEVRYPRPVVDVLHTVDLFCSVNPKVHLAIQVKTYRYSGMCAVTVRTPGFWPGLTKRFGINDVLKHEIVRFTRGLSPLTEKAKQRGVKIIPVYAFCAKSPTGVGCGELRADVADIASAWTP